MDVEKIVYKPVAYTNKTVIDVVEAFKGKELQEKETFPDDIGVKHPFSFEQAEAIYKKVPIVQGAIDKCVDEYELGVFHPKSQFVLGVDIAGMGEDESVFMVVEKDYRGRIRVNFIDNHLKNKPREVVGKCTILNGKYNFEMVYLDETGAGEGPTDWLKENMGEEIVEGVRFSVKSKMDMYSNLKKLMQQGKLKIPNHKKLLYQLADLKYEMMSSGDMKIHHSVSGHDDYCDALALACLWFKDDSDSYDAFIM